MCALSIKPSSQLYRQNSLRINNFAAISAIKFILIFAQQKNDLKMLPAFIGENPNAFMHSKLNDIQKSVKFLHELFSNMYSTQQTNYKVKHTSIPLKFLFKT